MMKKEKPDNNRFKKAVDIIINNALESNVFSGCSIAVSVKGPNGFLRSDLNYGYTEKTRSCGKINSGTYFDLASLTKPLVTALCLAVLVDKKMISLNDSLLSCTHWVMPEDKNSIKIRDILCHSSGLPAHKEYFKKLFHIPVNKRKETVKKWILAERLLYTPGESNIYSDLGYIILGMLIEEKICMPLDVFWKSTISTERSFGKEFLFSGDEKLRPSCCTFTQFFREKTFKGCGFVHDDNCRSLGGICGHAGLFGTALSVLSLCELLLDTYRNDKRGNSLGISTSVLRLFFEKEKKSSWSCGFDIPAKENSSCGKFFSRESRGHLGFTGTSFWMDLERNIIIVFLTNRVHCSKENKAIKKVRPLVHNAIMKELVR
jgi:CubicO group peptidase (beta-lactamase class C family)